MTAAAVLDSLQREGVTLYDREGQLFARDRAALTEAQAAQIRDNKAALLLEVQKRPALIRELLADMGGRIEL